MMHMVTDVYWYMKHPHLSHYSYLLSIRTQGIKVPVTHDNYQGRPRPCALSVAF